MYSYKINNSYTVYVNYAYINDCVKAAKKREHNLTKKSLTPYKNRKPIFTPLPKNTKLMHKTFGVGKVISTDKNGIMVVEFKNKTAHFVYPDAIKQGFLSRI